MGIAKKLIRSGIGAVGNYLMNIADAHTGGLAGKLMRKTMKFTDKNSGLIGKVVGDIGRSVLPLNARNALTNASNKAIDLLPSGKIKDTLKSINESAVDRNDDRTQYYQHREPSNLFGNIQLPNLHRTSRSFTNIPQFQPPQPPKRRVRRRVRKV